MKGQEGIDRARPKTAKVGGLVHNLRTSKNMQPHPEQRFTLTQKPARLESAHIAGTAGLHQHRKNGDGSKPQSQHHFPSSRGNDSNVQIRKGGAPYNTIKERAKSGHGNTVGILSKVSGAQSTYTHFGPGLVINSSQAFRHGIDARDSEKASNGDLIEHGLAGMHSMNTMHMSERYRPAPSGDRYEGQEMEIRKGPMSQ